MKIQSSSILIGEVAHTRTSPVHHKLSYRTFSLLLDLDNIGKMQESCNLFSHNRWNVFSFFDKDHADGKQTDLAQYARTLVADNLEDTQIDKVYLMTYPRVFGYVFNPLSVYFCHSVEGECVALIYEVSNTFGEWISYIQKIENQQIDPAAKKLLVSPFNEQTGNYTFKVHQANNALTIGVSLRDKLRKPILKTWYKGNHVEPSDWQIIRLSLTRPFMTLKVTVAIHYEALKLWLKGLRPPKSFSSRQSPISTKRQT